MACFKATRSLPHPQTAGLHAARCECRRGGLSGWKRPPFPHTRLLYPRRNIFPGGRSAYISLGRGSLMASLPEPQKWLEKERSRFFGICIWRWARRRGGELLTKAFVATNPLPLFLSLLLCLQTASSDNSLPCSGRDSEKVTTVAADTSCRAWKSGVSNLATRKVIRSI